MKIKYFDKTIEALFFASIFLTPVIFDRRIGIVFSGTKSASIRIMLLVILTLWLIKLLLGGKHIFKRTILDWPVLSFLLVVSAATISSINPILSFFGFYGRYEGLITWYCYALFFFIAVNCLKGFDKLKQLIAIILPTATAMAVYGMIQRQGTDPYVWGGVVTWQRVIATIGQPNFLSAYMDMSFFLIAFFLFTQNVGEKKEKLFENIPKYLPILYYIATPLLFMIMIFSQTGQNMILWYLFFTAMTATSLLFTYKYQTLPDFALKAVSMLSLLLIYICNLYTQSRGGYLGFMVAFVMLFVFVPRERIIKNWKFLFGLALAILTVTGFTAINPEFSPFSRFTAEVKIKSEVKQSEMKEKNPQNTVELGGAAGSRGETWKSAFGIIADNPVFGIGPEALKMVFPRYETDLFRFKEAFHVKQDRCHNETFDVPVTKGLLTFFIYIYILYLIYAYGLKEIKKVDDDKKVLIACSLSAMAAYIIQNQFSFGVIAITSLFWVIWVIVVNINSIAEKEEEKEFSMNDIPWLKIAIVVIVALILGYISILQFEADKEFKMGKNFMDARRFKETLPYFKKAIDIFPFEGGVVTHYGISLLNSSFTGEKDISAIHNQALEIFNYGIKTDPYNADNFYISSRIYMMQGNVDKAKANACKSLKIDPYYAESHLILAAISEKTGDMISAQKHYNEAYKINPNLSEPKIKIANKALESNDLDKAFNLFQELLISDPKNPDVHNGLGTIYHKRGQRDRAREEFEQTLSLDPNNSYAKMMTRK